MIVLRQISYLLASLVATAAHADGPYVGASIDYHYPHSGDAQTVTSAIAGLGFDTGSFAIGAQAEYGVNLAGPNDYDTARVGGWLSRDWNVYDLRLSGGITEYYFDDDTAGGFHFGLAAERMVTTDVAVRAGFIRDFMDNTFTDAITTTRIAVLYRF